MSLLMTGAGIAALLGFDYLISDEMEHPHEWLTAGALLVLGIMVMLAAIGRSVSD